MIMLPASPDTGNAQLTAADRHSAPATNHASAHPVSHGAASSHVAQTLKLIVSEHCLLGKAISIPKIFCCAARCAGHRLHVRLRFCQGSATRRLLYVIKVLLQSLVVSPLVIRKQMLFRTEIMLKMFLAATVVGGLIISVLELMKWRQRTSRVVVHFRVSVCIVRNAKFAGPSLSRAEPDEGIRQQHRGRSAAGHWNHADWLLSGTSLFAANHDSAELCLQGTVFAQLGAGVSSAPWVLLGGFAGTVLFRSARVHLAGCILISVASLSLSLSSNNQLLPQAHVGQRAVV
jgi:hypothetical protein